MFNNRPKSLSAITKNWTDLESSGFALREFMDGFYLENDFEKNKK